MAITYGFYNSINKDRLYDATQFSQIFDGVINDGVYMSVLNHFAVREYSGMTVIVGGGRAWFNHTWTYNDSDYMLLIDDAEIAAKRIDAIVLKVNTQDAGRVNTIEVIKGVPAATDPQKPTFPDGSGIYYHPLAYVNLDAGVTTITTAMIENCIGVDPRTPFVTGIIETIDATELVQQWGAQWDEWNEEHRQAYLDWIAQQEQDMTTWTDTQQQLYLDWVAEQEQAFENYVSAKETEYENWVSDKEGDYDTWVTNKETEYDTWVTNKETEYDTWTTTQQNLFLAWFDHIKGQLDEDAAGRLQNEIDVLSSDLHDEMNELRSDMSDLTEDMSDLTEDVSEIIFKEVHDLCNRNTQFEYRDGVIFRITSTSSDFQSVSVTTFENTENGKIITTVVTKDGWRYTETVTIDNDTHIISESYTKEEVT